MGVFSFLNSKLSAAKGGFDHYAPFFNRGLSYPFKLVHGLNKGFHWAESKLDHLAKLIPSKTIQEGIEDTLGEAGIVAEGLDMLDAGVTDVETVLPFVEKGISAGLGLGAKGAGELAKIEDERHYNHNARTSPGNNHIAGHAMMM